MQKRPVIRIVSDGTIGGTKVTNDRGEMIGRISRLEIEMDIRHAYPKVRLEIMGPEVDVKAQLIKIRRRK